MFGFFLFLFYFIYYFFWECGFVDDQGWVSLMSLHFFPPLTYSSIHPSIPSVHGKREGKGMGRGEKVEQIPHPPLSLERHHSPERTGKQQMRNIGQCYELTENCYLL